MNLKETALHNGKLKRFVSDTVGMLKKLDTRKHQTAVMTVYHAAQFGEASQLNVFFNALKVNDQSALKAWIVSHFSYEVENDNTGPRYWLMYTNKKNAAGEVIGWHVLKNTSDHRVDQYNFDELMELEPFYNTDVSKPKVWDVNALLDVLIKAADTIEKKSEKENITLPSDVLNAIAEAKRLAVLRHVDDAMEAKLSEQAANNDSPSPEAKAKVA